MSKEDIIYSMAREILSLRMKLMNREVGVGNCPHKMFPLKNGRDWKCGDLLVLIATQCGLVGRKVKLLRRS